LISENDLELTEKFFKKFGNWANFLGRMLPVVRTFISIPAGISKMDFWPFTISAFFGSFIWSYFLAWLGLKLGENWNHLEVYFRKFDLLIAIGIILVVVFWIYRHIKYRVRRY
jgi:membrane protein DedA with SNARE-associated domain